MTTRDRNVQILLKWANGKTTTIYQTGIARTVGRGWLNYTTEFIKLDRIEMIDFDTKEILETVKK